MAPDPKRTAAEAVDGAHDALVALSHAIHGHAETAFEEERSSAAVAGVLADAGFDVETGTGGLPTALLARAGDGDLTLTLCAEYDALPGIGHACGHNIIAAASVGAALALAPLADDLGITVQVLGTPAEESGGGKIRLLEAGAFDGTHLAMMVHPSPMDGPIMPCVALAQLDVRYSGLSAHASAFPEQGRNAADGLTVANVAIGLMRQHVADSARLHGITLSAGDAPNVVPERAEALWYVRDRTRAAVEELVERVTACFEGGATATGTRVEVTPRSAPYAEFVHVPELVQTWRRNAHQLGRTLPVFPGATPQQYLKLAASTDMANVSQAVPSLHPVIAIETGGAVNHQPRFTAAAVNASADAAVRDGAVALAWTAIDAATRTQLREPLVSGELVPTADDETILRTLLAEVDA